VATVKFSSKIDERAWEDLKRIAKESHKSVSGLLTEAVEQYVKRHRVRPEVLEHLEDSIRDNEELYRRLAR
jgi:predicted transcriptional regulator